MKLNKKPLIFIGIMLLVISLNLVVGDWTTELNEDIVAYWSFDEGSGTTANNNISTIYNLSGLTTNWVSDGLYGSAYLPNLETIPYIGITNYNLTESTEEITINVWINNTAGGAGTVLDNHGGNGQANNGWFRLYRNADGTFTTYVYDNTGYKSTTNLINNDTFQMITATLTATELNVYINGTLNGTVTLDNWDTDYDSSYQFFSEDGSEQLTDATVDEVGMWNAILSASDLSDIWNSGVGSRYSVDIRGIATTLLLPADNDAALSLPVDFSASIVATEYNITNATIYLWNATNGLFNQTINNVSGITNTTNFSMADMDVGTYNWNVFTCAENSTTGVCEMSGNNYTFTYGAEGLNMSYTNSTYETASVTFAQRVQLLSSLVVDSARLVYDGEYYEADFSAIDGTNWSISETIDIPTGIGNNTFHFNITVNDSIVRLSNNTHEVNQTSWIFCNSTYATEYLGVTFLNETLTEEDISATLTSTFSNYLGAGSENKTFSLSNSSENFNYSFCAYPDSVSHYTDYSITYDNSESEARIYNPAVYGLTSGGADIELYLLPTTNGIFTTFQIIDVNENPVDNALVTLSRSGYGTIASQVTGDAGTATFFLDPTISYTITVTHDDYDTYTTTDVFTQTSYTINIGGTTEAVVLEDYTEGISYTFSPMLDVLANNTDYVFNFTISSSSWDLDEYGFVLNNATGGVLGSDSGTTSSGGTATVNLNTGNEIGIVMNAYWLIDGNYTNVSRSWMIVESYETQFSLLQFFSDLTTYITSGFFGLDNFGLRLIIFLTIFTFTGIVSYKFGLTSPVALVGMVCAAVAFFDVGLGLIPNPIEGTIPYFPTILIGLITIAITVREAVR